MLTSSLLDCFFLVSDRGVDTADIASCRRGDPWWWESVVVVGKWKVPDCERGTGIRDIRTGRLKLDGRQNCLSVFVSIYASHLLEAF